ncbi:MAG: asparaginase [Rhodospirillales bacterium]|nr:asparaginase [Rhodospirillales bacterium]
MPAANPVLIEVMRGGAVESRHRGAVAIVDSTGRRTISWGDTKTAVFPRSAVKPLQALPMVESGAAEALAVSPGELALACASHSGEEMHVKGVEIWLARLGLSADDLVCGPHPPLGEAAAADLLRTGTAPSRLHNNCSGKHAGFLTLARHIGVSTVGYANSAHPVQLQVLATLAELADFDVERASIATDGCGVPVVAVPLQGLARAFARFAAPDCPPDARAAAACRVSGSMTKHPSMIGGAGRFDTLVVEAAGGTLLVKSGAEGVACAALLDQGVGIAVKIDDGGKRAVETAMAALLLRFASPDSRLRQTLEAWVPMPIRDTRGESVGAVRPAAGWLD